MLLKIVLAFKVVPKLGTFKAEVDPLLDIVGLPLRPILVVGLLTPLKLVLFASVRSDADGLTTPLPGATLPSRFLILFLGVNNCEFLIESLGDGFTIPANLSSDCWNLFLGVYSYEFLLLFSVEADGVARDVTGRDPYVFLEV